MDKNTRFTGIVLAADREASDPVAQAANTSCKAMAPVGGIPMIMRVMRALQQSSQVDKRTICGPSRAILEQEEQLTQLLDKEDIQWLTPQASPSTSALMAMQLLPDTQPILLTTADHALLSPEMVDYFCSAARNTHYDLVIALANHSIVSKAFPEQRRTRLRFREGDFCGCNLFAFLTHESRKAAEIWRDAERFRKHPARIAGIFGVSMLLLYLLRMLSLQSALQRLSRRTGIRIGVVVMPQPQAAIDVDSVQDWEFANTLENTGRAT